MAYRISVDGHVQGVGFRPFIYRLAHQYQLAGWVKNLTGIVEVVVNVSAEVVHQFADDIIQASPEIAKPRIIAIETYEGQIGDRFVIASSKHSDSPDISLPPDYSVCKACLTDLSNPADFRYQYPFINCTQCGPRYTIIKQLPYDRITTTMASFDMCAQCHEEYIDPLNRRFDAQPIACPTCGPSVSFKLTESTDTLVEARALQTVVAALHDGLIIAIKGIGGYHLCCDATNAQAIETLRSRKNRPDKPLAVLFPANLDNPLSHIQQYVALTPEQSTLLMDPMRPIVIIDQAIKTLPPSITGVSPGVGAMLPYSPLHYLLLERFAKPLVATSANISGEPVLTDNNEVEQRLSGIVDGFLHHNRPIQRHADDSVYRIVNKKPYPIRLGRGIAPKELRGNWSFAEPVLAVGGMTKNTVAIGWQDRVVISPHIADLSTFRSQQVFEQTIADLQQLYQIKATHIVCDAHQGYASTRWAQQQSIPVTQIYHHQAHASALYAEHDLQDDVILFTWDGVGLGHDGTLWGGETWFGRPGQWQRQGHIKPFKLPGGDKVARQPWRSAASIGWEMGLSLMAEHDPEQLLQQAWSKDLNSPTTTAVGRLFDAAAAMIGLCTHASFEGQGPMLLESHCSERQDKVKLPISVLGGLKQIDWQPLIHRLLDESSSSQDRAALFHHSLAGVIVDMASIVRDETGCHEVGLTGGVFQNRVLTELSCKLLQEKGFIVRLTQQVPCNDGGISFGQLMEFGYRKQG